MRTIVVIIGRDKLAGIWQRGGMNAKAELAELVENYLSINAGIETMALGSTIEGLAKIWSAYGDAKRKRGNWSTMLHNLRDGISDIEPALPYLRELGQAVAGLVALAERELVFAAELHAEIVRLSAGESTLA